LGHSNQGKIGEELNTRDWSFEVLTVQEAGDYRERNYQEGDLIRPQ
jgi:hypothetical protein